MTKPRALVICPANLKQNWVHEIKRLTGETPFVLQGLSPDMHVHFPRLLSKKDSWVIINYDILGNKLTETEERETNGALIRNTTDRYLWVELLNMCQFDIVFFDEVHYAKNVDAHRTKATMNIDAPRLIGLTGTPVLNRPQELWPFLNMIAPDKFPTYDGFIYQYTEGGRYPRNTDQLREVLKTLMLRRTKKEVMKDLPPINRIYLHHELSDDAMKRYQLAMQGVFELMATWNPMMAGEQIKIQSILAEMMRLKQICSDDKIESVTEMALEISNSDSENNGNSGKVLIFSQFRAVVEAIAARLGNEAVEYHGQVSDEKRQERIRDFREQKHVKFLVGTIQTMGTGLNLEVANNVIFVDYMWTPAIHQQAEERAYGRLADPHPIDAYYLTADNTIENTIQEILARKLATIEAVVEGLDVERERSVTNQILMAIRDELLKARRKK